MEERANQRFSSRPFWSELIGTVLLVLVGLSLVIVMCGTVSPVARLTHLKIACIWTKFCE
jgi:hypothetical protein